MGPQEGSRVARDLVLGLAEPPAAACEGALYRVGQGQVTMAEFLEQFGHRGPGEMELAAPRWREIPDQLEHLAAWLRETGAPDPETLRERAAQERERTQQSLGELLGRHGASSFASAVEREARQAQQLLPYRESARDALLRGYELIRQAVNEIARRLESGRRSFFSALRGTSSIPGSATRRRPGAHPLGDAETAALGDAGQQRSATGSARSAGLRPRRNRRPKVSLRGFIQQCAVLCGRGRRDPAPSAKMFTALGQDTRSPTTPTPAGPPRPGISLEGLFAPQPWRDVLRQRQQRWQLLQRLTVPEVIGPTQLELIGAAAAATGGVRRESGSHSGFGGHGARARLDLEGGSADA